MAAENSSADPGRGGGGFLARARALDSFILPGLKCQVSSPFLGNSLHFSSPRQCHISVKYAYVASTHKTGQDNSLSGVGALFCALWDV